MPRGLKTFIPLSELVVQAKDCYDPADYVLVHKDYLANIQEQHDELRACADQLRDLSTYTWTSLGMQANGWAPAPDSFTSEFLKLSDVERAVATPDTATTPKPSPSQPSGLEDIQRLIRFCEQVAQDGILPSQAWFQETADFLRVAAAASLPRQDWQDISTAQNVSTDLDHVDAFFWVVPKTAEETWTHDIYGNPIIGHTKPRLYYGRFGRWSSLEKATHWWPAPRLNPPSTPQEPT